MIPTSLAKRAQCNYHCLKTWVPIVDRLRLNAVSRAMAEFTNRRASAKWSNLRRDASQTEGVTAPIFSRYFGNTVLRVWIVRFRVASYA